MVLDRRCLRDEAIDGGFKVVGGSEDAAHQAPAREFGEQALDGGEPGCGGRGEVEGPAEIAGQPCAHLGMLVGGIVVDDCVDRLSLRRLRLDGIEEADELLMAVALHAVSDDGGCHCEGRRVMDEGSLIHLKIFRFRC